MINYLLFIGKIKKMPECDFFKSDNELVIEVKRNYKNSKGIFETDCFKCVLWYAISKKISLSCKEGDLVAVKGRLVDDKGLCKIIAEEVVLLTKAMQEEVFLV